MSISDSSMKIRKMKFPQFSNTVKIFNKRKKLIWNTTTSNVKDKTEDKKQKQLECFQQQQHPDNENNSNKNEGSFHEAMIPVLLMAQIFGIMPVINITSKNPADLFFTWFSFRTVYSAVSCLAMGFFTVITIYWALSQQVAFDRVVPIIFYVSNTVTVFYFGILAKKWPQLMKQWSDVEKKLPQYRNERDKKRLAKRIKLISFTILSLSIGEHLLSIATIIYQPTHCPPRKEPWKDFFVVSQNQLFYITDYNLLKGIIGKLVNILSTFAWSFMDLFVMLISVGLSSRFTRINETLFRMKGKAMSEDFWSEQRSSYRNLCNLCTTIDDAVAIITIVSFSNNLYFICAQLLNTLNEMPSYVHTVYFWFSLLYLIGRTLAVSLYSADINSESKKPIEVFRAVPRESWCIEVKRFSDEVTNDTVALSGMKFFYLTRGLVLSVAGTIVTYELVLIQFNQDEKIAKVKYC